MPIDSPLTFKQVLTYSNSLPNKEMDSGTRAYNKPNYQFCPHVYSDNTITRSNNSIHTISGSFICSSSNILSVIRCQPCPSTLYIGQRRHPSQKHMWTKFCPPPITTLKNQWENILIFKDIPLLTWKWQSSEKLQRLITRGIA